MTTDTDKLRQLASTMVVLTATQHSAWRVIEAADELERLRFENASRTNEVAGLRAIITLLQADKAALKAKLEAQPRITLTKKERPPLVLIDEENERECVWDEDIDGYWNGSCGVAWVFNDGGPVENTTRFCPQCGGKVRVEGEK